MKKPHVICIVADQLRYDVLGKGITPNIDSIAQQGVCFENAYCGSPLCVPARGSLFTGLSPNTNGSLINPWSAIDEKHGEVHEGIDNLYTLMEQGGWDCIHSGKQHLFTEGGKLEDRPDTKTRWITTEKSYKEYLRKNGRRAPGGPQFRTPSPEMVQGKFTRFCNYSNANTGCYEEGLPYYFDGYFTDAAIKGLRTRNKDKPLFLSAMFLAPHPPLDIPEPWYSRFTKEDIQLPENVGNWYAYQSPLQMYNLTGVIGSHYTREQWKESWRVYLGLVTLLDDCVGRLLAELKQQDIYDDSIIVFTSDHGEMLGSHRLFQKMCMYEESAKVPLYIRFPGGEYVGHRVGQTVSHIDVLPTLCHYTGVWPQNAMEGSSLHGLMEKTQQEADGEAFIQFDGNGARGNFQRCIVQGSKKLIMDIFKDEVYYELYDTERDSQETTNLLFEEQIPQCATELLEKLLQHMHSTNDMVCPPHIDLKRFVLEYSSLKAKQAKLV